MEKKKREIMTPMVVGSVLIVLTFQFINQAEESAGEMPPWLWIAPVIFIGGAIWAYSIVWKICKSNSNKKQE